MTAQLETTPEQAVVHARAQLAASEHDVGDIHAETIAALQMLALALVAADRASEGVELLRERARRAVERLGDENEATGDVQERLDTVLRRAGAPEAEQLACLTDAIKAFSASVGPSHPRTTAAFAQLANVALDAQAVEVAVTAAMQALGGLHTRGEGETAEAGGIYATLAMAAATRRSPAAAGAAERAHRLTATSPADDPDRRRAQVAWRALGSPRRHVVTDELSVVCFGAPRSLVVELELIAEDGAADQHNHGLSPEAARAFRAEIASAPFAWRASAGGFEVASRSGGGAVLRFSSTQEDAPTVEALLAARQLDALRRAVADALGAASGDDRAPGRNDPCPCDSGLKYKRCCGR